MTHCVLRVSTLGLSDVTDNQISRDFPLCISILQVIENWRPISLCFHNYGSKLLVKEPLQHCILDLRAQCLPYMEGLELSAFHI